MDLLKKLIPLVLVLVIAGGVFLWCMSADDIKLEPEEIPLGLEWGMTVEEAVSTLENAGCYPDSDDFLYYGHGYQGVVGADYSVLLWCEENGTLSGVVLWFYAEDNGYNKSYAPAVSKDILKELSSAIDKAYSKNCEVEYDDSDVCYFLHDNTLVRRFEFEDIATSLSFFDRYAECNKALVNEIIENAK